MLHLFFFLSLISLASSSSSSLDSDIEALLTFKNSSDPSNSLISWTPSTNPCITKWLGVSCSAPTTSPPRVTRLVLQNLSLSGPTGLRSLASLTALRVLSLKSNSLSGTIPDLSPHSSLRLLFLSHNNFTGPLPPSVAGLTRLYRLDAAYNHLSGSIPDGLNNITRLITLRLDSNNFTGTISGLSLPNLQDFNVSSNSLSGAIPPSLSAFPISSFANNPVMCGPPLASCKNVVSDPSRPRSAAGSSQVAPASAVVSSMPGNKPEVSPAEDGPVNQAPRGMSRVAVIAIVVGDFAVLVMVSGLLFCYFWRKFAGRNALQESEKIVYSSSPYAAAAAMATNSSNNNGGSGFERGKMVFFEGTKRFELEDLLRASAEMLGKGGYGTAYKAVLDDGSVVAVKRLREVGDGSGVRREFEGQMELIGRLRHPNLVALKAYYYAREEKLLVYEYMTGGSLYSLLHGE